MCAGSNQVESSCLQAGGESFNVVNSELDFNFAISGHALSIKKEEWRRRESTVGRKMRPGRTQVMIFNYFAKKGTFFIKPF
jgi:hypothetical protein